ncbi:MAG: membrane protein insertase YidC [Lachnospiraceae bacterium]|nr:membrane protein insertase YidC [Lachnospiraceae bacterium]
MNILYAALEWVMNGCYSLCNNYGWAIVLFTLISKIVLIPVSVWVQKNSIKMVKMQPEINFLKAKYYGDPDTIAEEQSKIFKREKYNAMASIIPLLIQILLLMGLIEVIKAGMANPNIDMDFYGVDLSLIPSQNGVALIYSPIIAGISAWILCVAQNASNVLQAEQSKWNKYSTMALSVGLSLYLGWFVSIGVALYWVASNIFAIIQLYILNWLINPKKYVDYEQLEKSKQALAQLGSIGAKKRKLFGDPETKREKADYKRFFSVVNKHIVFYSESNGFYKYYKGIIEYLLNNTNVVIHYITSDPDDHIFEMAKENDKIRPYYIGEKRLITLMMKMDADIVVMTMPDLDNYHIKRSYVRKDIEYIYIPHGMDSLNLTMRTGSMDHFDTIFCVGKHQKEEVEKTEEAYGLKAKKLVEWGYTLLDEMRQEYKNSNKSMEKSQTQKVLIAPSWQEDNIVDSCLEEILDNLKGKDYEVIVRPHPQHVRHRKEYMENLKKRYESDKSIVIQTDFSSNDTVFEADLMITDWSGIAYEYAYTTQKPVLFINTPMKVMNPEYEKIDTVPLNIMLREQIGCSLETDQLSDIEECVSKLLHEKDKFYDKIGAFTEEYVYNLGSSAQIGGKYIIGSLQQKVKERRGEKKE